MRTQPDPIIKRNMKTWRLKIQSSMFILAFPLFFSLGITLLTKGSHDATEYDTTSQKANITGVDNQNLSMDNALIMAASLVYVDVNAPAGGDGTSWATAYNDIQTAIDAVTTVDGDIIEIAEGTYTLPGPNPLVVSKELTIQGEAGKTIIINATQSTTYGIRLEVDNTTIQNLSLINAGTYGIHTVPGLNNLNLADLTVDNNGNSGIAINNSINVTIMDISANNNGGLGISIANCQTVLVSGVTTSGNTFTNGFSAGIGIFSNGLYSPPGPLYSDNITVSGLTMAEPVDFYIQDYNGQSTGTVNFPVTYTHKTVINDGTSITEFFAQFKAEAYAFADGIITADPLQADDVYVVKIATGDHFVDGASQMKIQPAITFGIAPQNIFVEDGTYEEALNVDKTIDITGFSSDMSTVILDGTNLGIGISGISLLNGVEGVSISYMTIKNYTGSSSDHAGIAAAGANNNLTIHHVNVDGNLKGRGGIYVNGSSGIDNVSITHCEAQNHNDPSDQRGIVIWNGFKTNINISNNTVHDNTCCGIELQDGSASGVIINGNSIFDNGDNGIGLIGLMEGAGANIVSGNTLQDNGRFGIEIKNPKGTGATSGDGSIVVENNNVSYTLGYSIADLRDVAGIAVFRRAPVFASGNPDIPRGVIVRQNTVSRYKQSSDSDGFGIVVEGTNHTVENNNVDNNDVGIQFQSGHLPYLGTGGSSDQGDQNNLMDDYFGRGNSPIVCAINLGTNTFTTNGEDLRMVTNAGTTTDVNVIQTNLNAGIENTNTGVFYCSIQEAIDDATAGDVIDVAEGIYPENLIINKKITINGVGKGADPMTNTILEASATCPGGGTGITISADEVTIYNMRIEGFQTGVTLTSTQNTMLDDLAIVDYCSRGVNLTGLNETVSILNTNIEIQTIALASQVGFRMGTADGAEGFIFDGGTIKGNNQGIYVAQNSTTPAVFNNVQLINSEISNNAIKGIYVEKLSNATLNNLIMDSNGTNGSYEHNAGIDINLKYGNYANITITNSTITNSGGTGAATDPENPTAIAIKARDDEPSYDTNPATLDNVSISNCIVSGPNNAIRFGEPGKINASQTNVTISNCDLSVFGNLSLINRTSGNITLECNWHGTTDLGLISAMTANYSPGQIIHNEFLDMGTDGDLVAAGFQPTGTCVCPVGGNLVTVDGKTFCSIQAAINDGDTGPGDVVSVGPGNYFEDIIIAKDGIEIRGNNEGIDACDGTRVTETTIYPFTSGADPFSDGVVVIYFDGNRSNIIIDGLTIDGNNTYLTSGTVLGFEDVDAISAIAGYYGMDDIIIRNNIIKNVAYSAIEIASYGNGFATTSEVHHNNISNVQMAFYGIGILQHYNGYVYAHDNCLIDVNAGFQTGNFNIAHPDGIDNIIIDNAMTVNNIGIWHNVTSGNAPKFLIKNNNINSDDTGIKITSLNGVQVTTENNVITGGLNGIEVWNCAASAEILLTTDIITGAETGIFINNFEGYNSDANSPTNVLIDGTSILNSIYYGLRILDSPSSSNHISVTAEILNSDIIDDDKSSVGVSVEGLMAIANVHNNPTTISGNDIGILVDAGTATITNNTIKENNTGVLFQNGGIGSVTVNNIFDNVNWGVENTTGLDIDATTNWWGNISGPGGEGPGTGDAVSEYVLFCPWLDNAWDAMPTAGVAVTSVKNEDTGTYFCSIQEAIDDVATIDGHTITVYAGTFNENITVDKKLTINGANAGISCGSRVAESILAPASGVPVTITADEVTINGFEITAPTANYAIICGSTSNTSVVYNNIHNIGDDASVTGNVHSIIYTVGSGAYDIVSISNNCFNTISSSNLTGSSASAIGVLQSTSAGVLTNLTVESNTIMNVQVNTGDWPTGKIAYGILINVGGSGSYLTTTGKAEGVSIANNEINGMSGFISTGIGLEGNTENAIVSGNIVTDLYGRKNSGDRAGGAYDLQALKFENNRYVGTCTVTENNFATETFSHEVVGIKGYAIANYVPVGDSYSGGTTSALMSSCNWHGSAVYNEIIDNASFTGKLFNKAGAETSFMPYLVTSNEAPGMAIGFQPETPNACSNDPVEITIVAVVDENCDNPGNITVTWTDGYGPFDISWTGGSLSNVTSPHVIPNLPAGSYEIVVSAVGSQASSIAMVGYNPIKNTTGPTYHASIQTAIDAATAGDVIEVCAGTYNERVNINKTITLQGSTADKTQHIIDGTGITGPGYGISISAAGVEIKNLTVENFTDVNNFGIHTDCGSDNLTIENVLVNNSGGSGITINGSDGVSMTNIMSTNNGGNGVSITDCSNVTIDGIMTSGNMFAGGFNAGIGLFSSSTYCTFNGISGFTLIGTVNIAEDTKVYSQLADPSHTLTGISGPTIEWAVGTSSTERSYWPDKATSYTVVNTLFGAPYNFPPNTVFVTELATGNFYVEDDPNGGSIEMSIDAAVDFIEPGKTIFVEIGDYNQQVTVDKSLTLSGPNVTVSGCDTRGPEAIIESIGSATPITVASSNVTISGFTITNPDGNYAILGGSNSDMTVTNNIILDIGTNGVNSNTHAVYVQTNTASVANVLIENNKFFNIEGGTNGSASAIYVGDTNGTNDVTGLKISKNCIEKVRASTATSYANGGRGAYGISIGVGAYASGEVQGAEISNNQISDLLGYWGPAIGLEGNTPGAQVFNNDIFDIQIGNPNPWGIGVNIENNTGLATVHINDNSFKNLDYGIANAVITTVDGTCNYWDVAVPTFAGNVNVNPYRTDGTDDMPGSIGFQPVAGSCNGLLPILNVTTGVYYPTIQLGVDFALAGEVLEIQPADYTEPAQIVIDKNLTIQGKGKAITTLRSNYNTGTGHPNDASAWIWTHPGTNVTIQEMTLDATGKDTYTAVRFKGDGLVDEVAFNEIKFSSSPYIGIAVQILDGNVDISNSMFTNIGRIGAHYRNGVISGAVISGTFSNNMYTGKGTGNWLDYALDISGGVTVNVIGNTITNNLGEATDGSTSGGILVTTFFPENINLPNNVTIENNRHQWKHNGNSCRILYQ